MSEPGARVPVAGAVVGLAVLLLACGASRSTNPGNRTASPQGSASLPTPFMIVARYSAKSLGLNHTATLTIGPDGNLYAIDLSQRVTVVSPGGKVLRHWGGPGRGPGEFRFIDTDPNDPTDSHGRPLVGGDLAAKVATAPDGTVYVSDSGNVRIQVFTAQGSYVREFSSFGAGKGRLRLPIGIVSDEDRNVYVTDDSLGNLTKFDRSGDVVWQQDEHTTRDPQNVGILHLTGMDPHGRLVMADDVESIIAFLDPRNGQQVDSFGRASDFPDGACDATVDAYGYTYVTDCGEGTERVFDRTHRLVAEWPATHDGLLGSPRFGPNGEVFAVGKDGSVLKLHITLPRD